MTLQTLRSLPQIKLYGSISEEMHERVAGELDELMTADATPSSVVFRVSTLGGDADAGERIAEEVRLLRETYGVDCLFFGHTNVFSAGATIMSAFPREKRFLSRNCVLMIHERRMEKSVQLSGALTGCLGNARALLAELETSIAVQERTFSRLIQGSDVSFDELLERAPGNWYLTADEAHRRGLVAAVL